MYRDCKVGDWRRGVVFDLVRIGWWKGEAGVGPEEGRRFSILYRLLVIVFGFLEREILVEVEDAGEV